MQEEPKEKDYQFINEIIIPKKKNKWLMRLETLGVVIFMAAVFGFVARWVFLSSDEYLRELLGMEEERQKVDLPSVIREASVINLSNGQDSYLQMYEEIRQLSENVSDSIVIVEAVEKSVDWFQETYETRTKTTGLILANDGIDLLILTDIAKIFKASSVEVYFEETKVPGEIYSIDKDYGLAIIAVPLTNIPKEKLQQIKLARITEEDIVVGTPVIALGAPNGYDNSMEVGMITSLGGAMSVVDGAVPYFTTNIMDYTNGHGFVFNLNGEVMGMITHTHKEDKEDKIFSAISLNDIRGVMVALLNNSKQAAFGIKGQNYRQQWWSLRLSEMEDMVGVYVTEVENGSPALNAGIKAGDIITTINGKQVEGILEFKELLLERSVGEVVQITFYKDLENKKIESRVQVKLEEKK